MSLLGTIVNGVHGVDELGVAFVDDRTADFERVGQLASFDGEWAWKQHKTLDLLIRGHLALVAVDAVFHHLVDFWIVDQFGVVGMGNMLFVGILGKRVEIGYNQG